MSRRGKIDHVVDLGLIIRRLKGLIESRSTLPVDDIELTRNRADLKEINKLAGILSGPEHYNIYEEVTR